MKRYIPGCGHLNSRNRVLIVLNMRSYTVAESLRGLAKKPPDNDVRLDVQKTQYGALYSDTPC
jgi:hypothetical protein